MDKKKIIVNSVLFLCVLAMAYICVRSITDQQAFDAEVVDREAQVKARLIEIRLAEEAYKEQHNGEYCDNFDALISFVKNGKLPIVQKEGVLSDEQMEHGLTEAKAAAIVARGNAAEIAANGLQDFRRDTVWVTLVDSLYKSADFDVEQLRYIPNSENKEFELIACPCTTKSGSIINVMECNAGYETFLVGDTKWKRQAAAKIEEATNKGAYPGLRIGDASMNWNNNAGNWE